MDLFEVKDYEEKLTTLSVMDKVDDWYSTKINDRIRKRIESKTK